MLFQNISDNSQEDACDGVSLPGKTAGCTIVTQKLLLRLSRAAKALIICYKSHACPVNIFYTKPRVETVVKRMKYVFLLLTLNIFNIFFLVFLLLTLKKYMLAGCTTASNLLLLFKYCWNINVIKTSRHNVDITT